MLTKQSKMRSQVTLISSLNKGGSEQLPFLMNLVKIGGCGNEDWQMLPFITDPVSGIDPDCENAGKYRELIGFEL